MPEPPVPDPMSWNGLELPTNQQKKQQHQPLQLPTPTVRQGGSLVHPRRLTKVAMKPTMPKAALPSLGRRTLSVGWLVGRVFLGTGDFYPP